MGRHCSSETGYVLISFSHHVDHACSGMAHRFQSDNIFVLSPTQSTPLASHQQTVQTNQIAFCWSGKKIFVTTSEGQIRILSYPEFEPVLRLGDGDDAAEFTLKGHTASCLTAELQPMGRYLATGGANSIIALWDTTDWLCQRTITRMTGPVRSISELSPKAVTVLDGGSLEANDYAPTQVSHLMVATSSAEVTKVSQRLGRPRLSVSDDNGGPTQCPLYWLAKFRTLC